MAALLERARLQFVQTQQKARLFDDVSDAAASWDAPRRLVMKAAWLPKGPHPRLVWTNLDRAPQTVYDTFYVQRGADSEHHIKALQLGLRADRLSCHTFIANQFRLLLAQAASILLLTIRPAATGTTFATAQVARWRSLLIQGAARVPVSARRVWVELAAYCPFAQAIRQIAHVLRASPALTLS